MYPNDEFCLISLIKSTEADKIMTSKAYRNSHKGIFISKVPISQTMYIGIKNNKKFEVHHFYNRSKCLDWLSNSKNIKGG